MSPINSFSALTETQSVDLSSWKQSLGMMRLMAQMEPVPAVLLETLLGLLPLKANHRKYFRGPVIIGKGRYAEQMPDWLLQAVRQERFLLILDEFEQGTVTEAVTPAEIVCALQPLTLEAPLRYEYARLCLWAFDQVMQRHNRLPEGCDSFFAMIGAQPVQPEQYVLQEVSATIRRRVVALTPSAGSRVD